MTVCFFLPEYRNKSQHSLLVVLFCLCKSFQRTLSCASREPLFSKANAKVQVFIRTSKSFYEKVSFIFHLFRFVDRIMYFKIYTHYYIQKELLMLIVMSDKQLNKGDSYLWKFVFLATKLRKRINLLSFSKLRNILQKYSYGKLRSSYVMNRLLMMKRKRWNYSGLLFNEKKKTFDRWIGNFITI